MTTQPEAVEGAAPPAEPVAAAPAAEPPAPPPEPVAAAAPVSAPPVEPAPTPAAEPQRVTPGPTTTSGDRGPQVLERTRRRTRRRRAPVFTPQEVAQIDYKDVDKLKRLISDRGRIEPRRKTGLTAKDQTKLAREIKRARHVALLPYTAEHMRQTSRFRMVTRMAERAARFAEQPPAAEPGPPAEPGQASAPPETAAPPLVAEAAPPAAPAAAPPQPQPEPPAAQAPTAPAPPAAEPAAAAPEPTTTPAETPAAPPAAEEQA